MSLRGLCYARARRKAVNRDTGRDVVEADSDEPTPKTVSVLAREVPAVQRLRLRGLNGELKGKTFDSSSDRLQIGTHPLNEVGVRDRTVSRFHCEVFVGRDGRVWVMV